MKIGDTVTHHDASQPGVITAIRPLPLKSPAQLYRLRHSPEIGEAELIVTAQFGPHLKISAFDYRFAAAGGAVATPAARSSDASLPESNLPSPKVAA